MRLSAVLAIALVLTASAKGQQNPSPPDSEPPYLVLDAGGHTRRSVAPSSPRITGMS